MHKRLAFAAIIAVSALALVGCSPTQSTFTARGTISVQLGDALQGVLDGTSTGDGACAIPDGYSDLAKGAQVVVKDSANRTVAIGKLTTESADTYQTKCTFHFVVPKVPAGLKIYGVEVTHRGVVAETEKELHGGVALSLGN